MPGSSLEGHPGSRQPIAITPGTAKLWVMTTRAPTSNGLRKTEANYLARIDEYLRRIDVIYKDIVRTRKAGRKVRTRIDRNLEEIQKIIDRVQANL
jgi:hypothetical protein